MNLNRGFCKLPRKSLLGVGFQVLAFVNFRGFYLRGLQTPESEVEMVRSSDHLNDVTRSTSFRTINRDLLRGSRLRGCCVGVVIAHAKSA